MDVLSTEMSELDGTDGRTTASSDGTVQLTLWGAEADQELLAQIVESFEQEYAGYANFDITITAQDESDCKDVLLEDVENGADVFTFVDDQLTTLVAAGALAPVPNADAVRAANAEAADDACSVNDTLYAYPLTADNGYFMFYNKAYFSEEDVKTLDRMLSVAAASGKKVVLDMSSGWYLYAFFGLTGLEVGINDDGITNYCNWNATEGDITGLDVAEAMIAMAQSSGFASMTDDDFVAGVQNGSVIAGVSGVWDATAIEEAWGSDYGAVKLPTYTCAGKQVRMASFAGYKMVGVNAYSSNTEWALKLADWISNEDNQSLRFKERGQGPANTAAASSPEVSAAPAIQALIAQSEYSSLQRIGGSYWTPVSEFGVSMSEGNPSGKDLQLELDNMVEAITATYGN
jgi:arabinogalactan oligomer/maltooligosaccharide transport system substrate-binding protein